jgi:hypothetical protein
MASFDDFTSAVLAGVEDLAQGELKKYVAGLKSDTTDFLNSSSAKLQEWTTALANKTLTQDEFDELVHGEEELAVMTAITKAGIGAARAAELQAKVVNLVIDKAFQLFL